MTLPTRVLGALACAAAVVPLAAPAIADARAGDATIQQTFPLATGLCAKVAAGTEKRALKPFVSEVSAACTTLQTQFNEAQSKVLATRTAVLPTLIADRTVVHAACPKPNVEPAACRLAHTQDDAAIAALRAQWKAAVHQYFGTLEAARKQFWTTIKALPVERRALADKPIAVPPR